MGTMDVAGDPCRTCGGGGQVKAIQGRTVDCAQCLGTGFQGVEYLTTDTLERLACELEDERLFSRAFDEVNAYRAQRLRDLKPKGGLAA